MVLTFYKNLVKNVLNILKTRIRELRHSMRQNETATEKKYFPLEIRAINFLRSPSTTTNKLFETKLQFQVAQVFI